jgi:hypothetical protein
MEIQPMIIANEISVITVEAISGNGTSSPARTLGVDVMVTSSDGIKNSVVAVSTEGFEEAPCIIHHGETTAMIASAVANIFTKEFISFFLRQTIEPNMARMPEAADMM